jgi:hypothetical protein
MPGHELGINRVVVSIIHTKQKTRAGHPRVIWHSLRRAPPPSWHPLFHHNQWRTAPPWPEIYVTDSERRHGLNDAVGEYQRPLDLYPSLGYEVTILPKVSAHERADFVLHALTE